MEWAPEAPRCGSVHPGDQRGEPRRTSKQTEVLWQSEKEAGEVHLEAKQGNTVWQRKAVR